MSNALLNWRFGTWHLMILRDRPFVRLSRNSYHDIQRTVDPQWRWFERY